jgi:DNA polymerase III epsilon subunit-like protein
MYNNFGGEEFKYNKTQKYITIDIETESLNLFEKNRPWQMGAVFSQGFDIIKTESHYITWDDLNVSKGAAITTGFNMLTVQAQGKCQQRMLQWLEEYLYDPEYRILWFNGLNFDTYIHNIWRKENNLSSDYSYLKRSIDVNAFLKAFKLGVKLKPTDDLLEFQYRFCDFHRRGFKTNLAQACKDFNIHVDESKFHDATFDTVQTLKVFEAIVSAMDI